MNTIDTLNNDVFKHLIMTVGELPTTFVESMSYYEMVAWLVDYIRTKVVPATNNNAEAIKEIQEWIKTLDLQDEVNNKIDEMIESGEMEQLLTQILHTLQVYDTVLEMKADSSLTAGQRVKCLGYSDENDGCGGFYLVTNAEQTDDNVTKIELDNGLHANLEYVDSVKVPSAEVISHDTLEGLLNADVKVIAPTPLAVSESLVISEDNVTIDGMEFVGTMTGEGEFLLYVQGKNVTVSNCKFSGTISNFIRVKDTSGFKIVNNLFDGSNGTIVSGVVCINAKNGVVANNTFTENDGFNLQMLRSSHASISSNTFLNSHYQGSVTAYGGQAEFQYETGFEPKRMGVRVNGSLTTDYTASFADGITTITLDSNANQGDVVLLRAYKSLEPININSNCKNITIEGNNITGSGDSGIVLGSDYHNGVLDPSSVTPEDYPRAITVTGNTITDCAYAGIAFTHAAPSVTIEGNNISNCGWITDGVYNAGIFIASKTYGLTVVGNTISNSSTSDDNYESENGITACGISVNPLGSMDNTELAEYLARNDRPMFARNSVKNIETRYKFYPDSNLYSQAGIIVDTEKKIYSGIMPNSTSQSGVFNTIVTSNATVTADTDSTLGKDVLVFSLSASGYGQCGCNLGNTLTNYKVTAGFWAKSDVEGDGRIDFVYQFGGNTKNNRPCVFLGTDWKYYEIDLIVGSNATRNVLFRVTKTGSASEIKLSDLSFRYELL